MTKLRYLLILGFLWMSQSAFAETTQPGTAPAAQQPPSVQKAPNSIPIPIPEGAIEAPFGLFWGMTKEDLDARGIALTADPDTSLGAIYMATGVPKSVADVDGVKLFLGFGGKLFKIIAVSREYKNDPYGSEVQARYDEVASVLKDKYGAGKEKKHVAELYDGNNWAMGISSNENWRYTDYQTKDLRVQISCRASGLANPFWVLVYEYTPGTSLEEKAQKEHEKGAL